LTFWLATDEVSLYYESNREAGDAAAANSWYQTARLEPTQAVGIQAQSRTIAVFRVIFRKRAKTRSCQCQTWVTSVEYKSLGPETPQPVFDIGSRGLSGFGRRATLGPRKRSAFGAVERTRTSHAAQCALLRARGCARPALLFPPHRSQRHALGFSTHVCTQGRQCMNQIVLGDTCGDNIRSLNLHCPQPPKLSPRRCRFEHAESTIFGLLATQHQLRYRVKFIHLLGLPRNMQLEMQSNVASLCVHKIKIRNKSGIRTTGAASFSTGN
jgi:hypothetical protein